MKSHTFKCVDGHTCGNPVRVVIEGGPELNGHTMSDKRQDFLNNHDWIRKSLMFEPRGHDMMSGTILYDPVDENSDTGVLFIETTGCLPMCGHGTIGTVTAILERGIVTPKNEGELVLEVPAGLVKVEYQRNGEFIEWVRIHNVASYLAATDIVVECPELGELVVDISYGGNYYAIVDPQKNYDGVNDYNVENILRYSPVLRDRLNEIINPVHPDDETVNGVSHILWSGPKLKEESHARNAVFYGENAIDRSPCGTGTSARMAQLAAKGKLDVGDEFIHESIIGSQFVGRVESKTKVGDFDAIKPSIRGWARVTGINTIFVDDRDPYAEGFTVK
ncbi:4-hydroxyproline epimerase [Pseudemcibacter aquimaris]|uniref:4-hydroxyproline epimerase n=1 Tax=Pseudemcibacter aquimaris TaxID=2857064 RepID=UPI002013BB91|nr:4-hydroxyproline epimerase [Pseudemcibacter aquimaris]MCC3862420.1 4-hydroxyproline epimerase [Pseudemcibacter aquimaris]WDU59150.1 4-hydroxyproline epimerase [Pseudemcibacter aquimaris]